jgi:hypothetical protein
LKWIEGNKNIFYQGFLLTSALITWQNDDGPGHGTELDYRITIRCRPDGADRSFEEK